MKNDAVSREEPFFIRQCGDPLPDGVLPIDWFSARCEEARKEGATFARYSIHPEMENLLLIEAWKERPADQGEIRWQLTSKP